MTRCLLALTLLFTGCRSDEPETETPATPDPAVQKERTAEAARLLNEKFTLTRELDQLLSSATLDSHAEFQTLRQSIRQAEERFGEIRQNHPRLQKLNRELNDAQQEARMAATAGRSEAADRAREQTMKIRGEITEVSQSLPELAAAQQTLNDLNDEVEDLRRALAAETPEGKALLEKIKAIEAKIDGD